MLDGTKIEIALITSNRWIKDREDGTRFQNWTGYLLYDQKPISEVTLSHCLIPKPGKKPWAIVSGKISQEEREEGKEAETFGFANFFETQNEKLGVSLKRGKFFYDTIEVPLLGWCNEVEIDGNIYKNVVLKTSEDLIARETENGKEYAKKIEVEWVDYRPNYKDVTKQELEDIVDTLALDYPSYPEWYVKFFPKTTREVVRNAAKREELFAKFLKKTEQPKLEAIAKPKAKSALEVPFE